MARFEQHMAISSALGIGWGFAALQHFHFPWYEAATAAVLCTVGGIVPDIDYPQSRFAEFVLSTSALLAVVLSARVIHLPLYEGTTVVLLIALFWGVRWGLRLLLGSITVHRGMVHSIPACGIWASLIFLGFSDMPLRVRTLLATAAATGFVSHLLLDELFAFVDASGLRLSPKRSLGSAFKLWSASRRATLTAYTLLILLLWLCWESLPSGSPP